MKFNASSTTSWKFALWCATFVESLLYLSQKSTEEVCVITLKNDAKFEEELICAWGIWPIQLNTQKSLTGLLLSKLYPVWTKQLHRSYASWDWRVMQYFKKIDWWSLIIFMRTVASLKICTLRVMQRKANSWEICIFLCDAIDKNLWQLSWMKLIL